MSDEGALADPALADPTRCPSCGAGLDGAPVCRSCGLPLTGADAQRLWELSQRAASILAERRALMARMRAAGAPVPAGPVTSAGPAPAAAWSTPAAPRPEWSRRRVQNFLLVLGVLLLGVAAVIFVAVSWGSLGVGARTAVLAAVTAVAASATWWTSRRELPASTEALAVLTTALLLLDGFGLRRAGVAALDRPATAVYWAAVLAVLAVAAALGVAALGTVTLQLVAVASALLPALLLGGHLADVRGGPHEHPAAWFALGALTDLALVLVLTPLLAATGRTRVARVAALVALAPLWTLLGVLPAGGDAFVGDRTTWPGGALLLGFAAAAALAGRLDALGDAGRSAWAGLSTGAAAVAAVLAAWTIPAGIWRDQPALPAALSVTAVLLLALVVALAPLVRLTRVRVAVAAAVATAATTLPGLAIVEPVGHALTDGLNRLDSTWAERATVSTRTASAWAWDAGRTPPLLLVAVAVAALLMASVAGRLVVGVAVAVVLVAAAVATVPSALDLALVTGVAADAALALGLLVGGLWAARRGDHVLARTAVATGAGLAAVAVSWSFRSAGLSVGLLPVLALATVLIALAPRVLAPAGPPGLVLEHRYVSTALAVATALGAVATVTRYSGAGWAAVWSATTAAALAAAVLAYLRLPRARDTFLAVAVALAGLEAATVAWWAGAPEAWRGGATTATVSVLAVGIAYLRPFDPGAQRTAGLVAAGAVVVPGLVVSAADTDVLWIALLAAGAGTAAVALRPGLGQLRWLALVLLTASSWVRLAIADVHAPEAYTVPPALVLLALAWWEGRRAPAASSWRTYGPGLSLALVPSLVRAVTDAGTLRPLLLGAAALAVLLVGVLRRLQAPLVIGGLVLAVDALVQLSPYLADLYTALPRWVSIGAAGLLLLGIGATFEQRLREVRRVRERFAGLR